MKKLVLTITTTGILAVSASAATLIQDDFTDGNLATAGAGVNGGVVANSNGSGGSGIFVEGQGNASIITSGNNNNAGLNSVSTFNGTGQTSLTVTYEISNVLGNPGANGIFLGLASDAGFYRNASSNFGFQIDDGNGPFGSLGIGLVANDNGGAPATGVAQSPNLGAFTLAELQDGFDVSFTVFSNDTFSTTVSGLGDADGTLSGSLSNGVTYAGLFEIDNVTAASVQQAGGGASAVSLSIDSLSVVAIPEPSSTALLGLGGLALILRRRK